MLCHIAAVDARVRVGQTRLVPVLTGGSGAAGRWRATAFSTCSARLCQRCHLLAAFDLVGAENPGWRHPGVSTGGTKRSSGAVASCLIAASPAAGASFSVIR